MFCGQPALRKPQCGVWQIARRLPCGRTRDLRSGRARQDFRPNSRRARLVYFGRHAGIPHREEAAFVAGGDDVLNELDGTELSAFPMGKLEKFIQCNLFFATFLVGKENFLYLRHELTECITKRQTIE